MNERLRAATLVVNKVVQGNDLSYEEAYQTFLDIFIHDTEGFHFVSLITALHTKGETADELLALVNTTESLGVKISPNVPKTILTDLSGTGASKVKTINVSTAASFIVAAAGYCVAKQAGFAQTSPTGSADIFRMLGINVFELTKEKVERTLETIGICPFFISAMSPRLKNRSQLARNIFVENGLGIESPFHLATFAFSPTELEKRIYGCYDEKYMDILGELFVKLGNKHTLILHGVGGIPEASVVGKTIVVEQKGNRCRRYTLEPEDFALKTHKVDDIRTGGTEQNLIDFLRILTGKQKGAKRDLVLANASASLYAMGHVSNFKDGTEEAAQLLDVGAAYKKLRSLVDALGDTNALDAIEDQVRIGS